MNLSVGSHPADACVNSHRIVAAVFDAAPDEDVSLVTNVLVSIMSFHLPQTVAVAS